MATRPERSGGASLRRAPLTTSPVRGEIWSVRLPGKPDDPHQPRPALVVSANVRNRVADDVIVVPIFSLGATGPTHVPLPRGSGGIKKDSVLFCEELTTLDREFLYRGPWGPLVEPEVLHAVVRAIRRAVGETLTEPA